MLLPLELPEGVTDGEDLILRLSKKKDGAVPEDARPLVEQQSVPAQRRKRSTTFVAPLSLRMWGEGGARPGLARKLENMIKKEVKTAKGNDEAVLRVYQEAFGCFIEQFPSYKCLLSMIRIAYDDRASYCSVLEEREKRLKDELATCSQQALADMKTCETEAQKVVQTAENQSLDWQHKYEDCSIELSTLKSRLEDLSMLNTQYEKRIAQDQKEKEKLRSTLAYLGDVSHDLKKKIESQQLYYKQQQETFRAREGSNEYLMEALRGEISVLEEKLRKATSRKKLT
eukprot:TRINITY_DN27588_c0_g1_i1.p1 TRINITY_DN27588_c0_g1~~TRINITY_DN27588_c0_g1_i1.p1  ORF type:complete len:304 (+),score=79.99 TRINITY_DN27588_c0_g1_i1:59-913(+)